MAVEMMMMKKLIQECFKELERTELIERLDMREKKKEGVQGDYLGYFDFLFSFL